MQLKKEVGDGSVCDYPRGRPEETPAQNRPLKAHYSAPPFAAALRLAHVAFRGALRLVRPIKMNGFCPKRKRFVLQTIHFYGVLNNYHYTRFYGF